MAATIKEHIPEQLQKLVIEFLNSEAVTLKDVFTEMECEKIDEFGQCMAVEGDHHFCNLTDAQKYSKFAPKIVAQLTEGDTDVPALLPGNFEHFLSSRASLPAEQISLLFKNLHSLVRYLAPEVMKSLVYMSEQDELKQWEMIGHISECWWSPSCQKCPFKAPAERPLGTKGSYQHCMSKIELLVP